MRYYFTAFFILILNFTLLAQGYQREQPLPDSLIIVDGDTLTYVQYKVQPYVNGALEISNSPDSYLESYTIEGGIIFKNNWMIGAQFTSLSADIQRMVIFPNNFSLSYMHGGFHVGYRTHLRKFFDVMFLQKVSFGEMYWEPLAPEILETLVPQEILLASRFTMIQPTIGIDLNLSRYLKFHGNLGYRFVSGLDLAEAPAEDFSGPVFQLGLKVGLFNYIKK